MPPTIDRRELALANIRENRRRRYETALMVQELGVEASELFHRALESGAKLADIEAAAGMARATVIRYLEREMQL